MSDSKNETKNHVVRSNTGFYGTWGRGNTLQEAMKNAKIKFNDKTPFTYFHFKNNDWDITNEGCVKWKEEILLHQEEFKNGFK